MSDYKVQFEVFEGPLDLLLYLVRKQEVDIYDVDLARLATQFTEYLDLLRELDLEVAGDFLVMASTLMYIKSRELLPVDQQTPAESDEDDVDPRWELIRQLVEYKKFKDAAAQLQSRELDQENVVPRIAPRPEPEPPRAAANPETSLFDLLGALSQVLQRFQEREAPRDIYEDRFTISEKIEFLRELCARQPRVRFFDLFAQTTSRSEVVATFLALLELVRMRLVRLFQARPFHEIEIHRCDPDSPAPDTPQAP